MQLRPLLTAAPTFPILTQLAAQLRTASLPQLFLEDRDRARDLGMEAAGLTLDFSRQLVNRDVLAELLQLARDVDLGERIKALFAGERLNTSEGRPALHTLLRASSPGDQRQRFQQVLAARQSMQEWSSRLNRGEITGFSGEIITDVVNIGIGGSDLGPRLVSESLAAYHGPVKCHYVANIDPAELKDVLQQLVPESTLFIICSKSFTTEETLANSLAARRWLENAGASQADIKPHFLAITSNLAAASEFGLSPDCCLPMWDWVGGRFSVWSAIGLSCAIAIGWDNFEQFLAGAEAMDQHFANSNAATNMPVLLSLLEVWNTNFLGAATHAVLPYAHRLRRLPDYLQQLTMESNGKRVSVDGIPLDYSSSPILWGAAGTIGQHSFHQLLHQGPALCPVDFVLPLSSHDTATEQHHQLVSNCLAQSRALMLGRSLSEARALLEQRGVNPEEAQSLAPHLALPGNRPHNIISMNKLEPSTLGALLSLYEHRCFCSAQLWGINPFDQWGVELGKELGSEVLARMKGESGGTPMDAATEKLLSAWQIASAPQE